MQTVIDSVTDTIKKSAGPLSIFSIVDHSSSMSSMNDAPAPTGARYTATQAILDSIATL
jgi:hypothetical protein